MLKFSSLIHSVRIHCSISSSSWTALHKLNINELNSIQTVIDNQLKLAWIENLST